MKLKYIIISSILFISSAQALDFKIRAREHYQVHTLKINTQEGEYTGFSPSINLWWEDPYKLSYGFVIKPGLGKYKRNGSNGLSIKSFRLYKLGGEVKFFPKLLIDQFYIRLGLGISYLTSNELNDNQGYHAYGGIGFEIPIYNFGLALEAALQKTFLKNSIKIQTFLPSIGFHFYKMF